METGSLVYVVYGYGPDSTDEHHYAPIQDLGLYLGTTADGREEVLLPSGHIVQCRPSQIVVKCFADNPCYPRLRAELFPLLAPGAEHEIFGGVMMPDEGAAA